MCEINLSLLKPTELSPLWFSKGILLFMWEQKASLSALHHLQYQAVGHSYQVFSSVVITVVLLFCGIFPVTIYKGEKTNQPLHNWLHIPT